MSPAQGLERGASDQEVLSAVVEHYVRCFASSEKAREVLGSLGVDDKTAVAFRVGYSDRSLGPSLPARQLKRGGELRVSAHPARSLPSLGPRALRRLSGRAHHKCRRRDRWPVRQAS